MALRFRGLDAPIEVVYRKSSGSAPQPVDPYQQAAAQYGLSTGTAAYNAGLNRTNQNNPIGSSYWTSTSPGYSYSAPSSTAAPSAPSASPTGSTYNPSVSAHTSLANNGSALSAGNLSGGTPYAVGIPSGLSGGGMPIYVGGGPPTYTETTQLAPQFQSVLEKPIDTSGIAGMPGGPSTTQDLATTRDALYRQQMAFVDPEQKIQSEQEDSKLANMGATIGSPAWNTEQDRLAREQEFTRGQARDQAITGGGAEQSRLFGLGSQSLQNQIAARNAPISEYNSLTGAPGASATALTPDISGAFGQQYQGQLAGYNANVASNNADTSAAGSLIASYLMYLALA